MKVSAARFAAHTRFLTGRSENRWRRFLLVILVAGLFFTAGCHQTAVRKPAKSSGLEVPAPAGNRFTEINPTGETILPNGRLITPRGVQVKVAPHPYGLTLSPDGKTLATANSGTAPFSVSIITNLAGSEPQVVQIPPGFRSSDADPESVFMGVAIARDNHTLYVSEGDNGRIGIFDLISHRRLGSVDLNGSFRGKNYQHSLTGEMMLSHDGRRLFVLDLAHFRLAIIDAGSRRVTASIPVGRLPFGLTLSPDGRRVYVSNVGMFRYSLIPGYDPENPKDTGVDFPPFGFPSKAAQSGTVVEGKRIPGVGNPNTAQSNSLWVLDVSQPDKTSVIARIPTGIPVGPKSVGGSSPGAVVAGRKWVFVSNASQDSITVIDAGTNRVKKTVLLEPASSMHGLRGVLPFGMALSPDEKRLYVACSGINAVAVLDAGQAEVLGYIPTAWFPARVAISPEGKTLYVANAKGYGAGPNGGPDFHKGPEGDYIGDITKGVVSIIPVPEEGSLHADNQQVLRNNGFINAAPASRGADFPVPPPGRASQKIRHVVFIVKENRTFDQFFGDLKQVNGELVEGDPALAEYGDDVTIEGRPSGGPAAIKHVRASPNHHALAERFGVNDNFYVDSDVSMDGHHWLVDNYPNEFVEADWPAAYGGKLHFAPDNDAPGRLSLGSYTVWPESYLEAGSLWEHLARHGITFRNYGEGVDLSGHQNHAGFEPTGIREAVNTPMPEVLFENTSRTYPTFNTSISDQYRLQQFRKEFEDRYASGKEPLPQFIYIWLPNDHTGSLRPSDGYPYRASYVADNDYALGQLVQLFSHSRFWKDMAIFVTEDDAQDGTDHVDAHRSLLLVISPYSRRGVSHVHTCTSSILKTIDLIFGLPYLNQYDATAADLADSFTNSPDFSPYNGLPVDSRIFDPAKVVEQGLRNAQTPSAPLDDPATIRREMRSRAQRTARR